MAGLTELEKHGLAQMDWSASGLVNSFYHVFDNNESGTIDMKEFVVGVAMLTKGTLQDKIKCSPCTHMWSLTVCVAVAFDIIDVNKSGSLDKEEMSTFLKCLIQSGPAAAGSTLVSDAQLEQIVSQAFSVIDVNKDEKIEFDEFTKWATSAGSGAIDLMRVCDCLCRQLDCSCILLNPRQGSTRMVI